MKTSTELPRALGIELDPTSSAPLYHQLADAIVARIRSGALAPGARLPPTRLLAEQLGVHRNTTIHAYTWLTEAGFTTSAVGRGTFVTSAPTLLRAGPSAPGAHHLPIPWETRLSRAGLIEPASRAARLNHLLSGGDPINLARLEPPEALRPHETLRRCMDHVLSTSGPKALGYSPPQGMPRLRRLIAAELSRSGVPAHADQILITTGSQQAVDMVARLLVDPGETFLVDEATYTGALNILSAAGARAVGVPDDGEGPSLSALKSLESANPKAFYLMPNCSNPTGRQISLERRRELVAWSHSTGVPLIEDDYGADLILDGPPPPALRALSGEVIHVGTYSKKLIPALRVGYLVAPPRPLESLITLKRAMDLGTSALLQLALAEFLERGYLDAHLQRTLPIYRARRDALYESLCAHLPPELTVPRPGNGVIQWLPLPAHVDAEAAFTTADRHGVLVTPSSLNAVRPGAMSGLRLVYCAEPPERLWEAGRRMGLAMAEALDRGSPTAEPLGRV